MKYNRFAEKHPRLNALIGLVLLAIIAYFIIIVIKLLLHEISSFLIIVSNLDAVIIVALITGSLSLLVAIVSKIIDYFKAKREYLSQKREKPYEDFIEMFYKIQSNANKTHEYKRDEMISDITKISRELTLWGSQQVVNKWIEFRKYSQQEEISSVHSLYIFEDILNQMRKDIGTKKVKRGNLLGFVINDVKSISK